MSKSRPELNNDAKFVIDTFIERGLFKTQTEVISAALDLLFDKQMELDVALQKAHRPDYSQMFDIQLESQTKPLKTKSKVG